MNPILRIGATLLLLLAPLGAQAHKESDAYLDLRIDPHDRHVVHGQFDIALRDLAFVIDLDRNNDGVLTWGEVRAQRQAIEQFALAGVELSGDGLVCAMQPRTQMIDQHNDGAYDVIGFDAVCDKDVPSRLKIRYSLFADVDPYHRGIITLRDDTRVAEALLGPQSPDTVLDLQAASGWSQFESFLVDGLWHIWTGVDHMLFIMTLLLPAVLLRVRRPRTPASAPGDDRARMMLAGVGAVGTLGSIATPARERGEFAWEPAPRFGRTLIELVKVVSAFTLSHSVTLTLSVLGYVHLPSRLVESGIALSVAIAALNNVVPLLRVRPWIVAFTFGLIHGLGFASALAGLALPPLSMAIALLGFSLGIELGQQSVVLPLLPLAFAIRRTRFYRVGVLGIGSMLVFGVAILWLLQRAFDIVVPGTAWMIPP